MKKLLGVSLVAALAVLPVAANAAAGDRIVQALEAGAPTSSTNLASTSYVQGAYKAVADTVDDVIADTAVGEGDYAAIGEGKTVSHNLVALDTAIKNLGSGAGSVANQVKTGAQGADFTNTTSGLTATTIAGAINEVEGRVDTAESDINTIEGNIDTIEGNIGTMANLATEADNLVGAVNEVVSDSTVAELEQGESYNTGIAHNQTVAENLVALDTAIGTINANSGSLAADGHYIEQNNTVSENLVALDGQVYTNAGNISTNATNIATINNKQIPIVTDWANGTTVQKKISELVTYVP